MKRKPIKSSLIKSAGYDPETKVLEIEFASRANPVYQYSEFSAEAWQAFKKAASKGSHFLGKIKGKYAYDKTEEKPIDQLFPAPDDQQ